jgi:lipopolysaccharide biosynthesis glycosyltransferase
MPIHKRVNMKLFEMVFGLCFSSAAFLYVYSAASMSVESSQRRQVLSTLSKTETQLVSANIPAATVLTDIVEAISENVEAISEPDKNSVEATTLIATMLTGDDSENYGMGALMLIRSIKRRTTLSKTDFRIIELDSKPLQDPLRSRLAKEGWSFLRVPRIAPRDEAGTFPRFRDQFSKLNIWNLTQYTDRILYFDSDCLATGSLDELLSMNITSKPLWVARDLRNFVWEQSFNMGVFMIKPSHAEFKRLVELKNGNSIHFETAMSEQGFLNEVYKNQWGNIGFRNNANLAAFTQQRKFWDEKEAAGLNVIHYTMVKPWACEPAYAKVCSLWDNEKNDYEKASSPAA